MKRVFALCFVLLLLLLVNPFAMADFDYVSSREYPWGTTKESIVTEKGTPDDEGLIAGDTVNVCYLYDTLTCHYYFRDDKLFRASYIEFGMERFESLCQEYTNLYGNEVNDPYLFSDNMEIMGLSKDTFANEDELIKALQENDGEDGSLKFKSWKIDSENFVILTYIPFLESGFSTSLFGSVGQ